MAERGAIVLRRVRIMIGGASCWEFMIPSRVGSFDMAMIDSISPASRSCPTEIFSLIVLSTSRARPTWSVGPSICTILPRAEMNTPSRFSTWTRLASNCPNSAPSRAVFSNSTSVRERCDPSFMGRPGLSWRGL